MVIRLEPSIGLATGGFQVTVIGRNIWVQSKPTTGNTFKVLLDNRAEVSASKATGCADMADCEDKLVFTVPTASDPSGPMALAAQGIPIEITVNGKDYTMNQRKLRISLSSWILVSVIAGCRPLGMRSDPITTHDSALVVLATS